MAKIVSKQSRSSNASPRSGIGGDEQTAKDRILEVAEELVAEHGPYGFRLQDVADRLNVKPPALYNHFTSRDDLIARLAEKGFPGFPGRVFQRTRRRSDDILSTRCPQPGEILV